MKVNTITYKREKSTGSYNSQSLELTVTVQEDEDENVVLDWLKARVEYELGITLDKQVQDIENLAGKKQELARAIDDLELRLDNAKQRWEKVKAFLEKQGVSSSAIDDIPF